MWLSLEQIHILQQVPVALGLILFEKYISRFVGVKSMVSYEHVFFEWGVPIWTTTTYIIKIKNRNMYIFCILFHMNVFSSRNVYISWCPRILYERPHGTPPNYAH